MYMYIDLSWEHSEYHDKSERTYYMCICTRGEGVGIDRWGFLEAFAPAGTALLL